ncbi:hypothetical protein FRB95_009899 [Tulasnella sp. JGI-2019a]|nr:hypothetical protein FRB95_009899 [Tulasnella sp. JGI-2019a]
MTVAIAPMMIFSQLIQKVRSDMHEINEPNLERLREDTSQPHEPFGMRARSSPSGTSEDPSRMP